MWGSLFKPKGEHLFLKFFIILKLDAFNFTQESCIQFQKRKYAKFKWFRCGKKGYGLQLQEDASRGQFLIEYVGEVKDVLHLISTFSSDFIN